jgi:methyl-accepting chemotaxis protein
MEKAHAYNSLFANIIDELNNGEKQAVITKYHKIFTEWSYPQTRDILWLVKFFSFHPLVKKMVTISKDFHEITRQYLDLADRYTKTNDDQEKQLILSKIYSLQKDIDKLPADFNKAGSNLSEWARGLVTNAAWIIGLLFVIGCSYASYCISQSIVKPVASLSAMLQSASDGDLTKQIIVTSDDEIGDMSQCFNQFLEKLHTNIKTISDNANTVASSAVELSATSAKIAGNTREMSLQTRSVASTTELATANVNTISSAAEEMSSSTNSVATAIEEMSASLNEVSRNCQKELKIAAEANNHSRNSKEIMDRLGIAANAIGKVVEVINDIADQTNLLALNATIEAASAGDAGKGFAVVANEVKELAKQTQQATLIIEKQVEDIQSNTASAVKAIVLVTSVIEEVNLISQTIVCALEQQSATINEISRNVTCVSTGARDVARNVNESARGLNDVFQTIAGVSSAVADTALDITQVKSSADELAKLSENLKTLLGQFKV